MSKVPQGTRPPIVLVSSTTQREPHGVAHHREERGLAMVCSPAEAERRLNELHAFVQKVMVAGVDYGLIPGTGDKPSLFQPGAQKLAELYGFAHRFSPLEEVKDWERGFFYFEKKCVLTQRSDGTVLVGEGIGSCNSKEKKYAGRWAFERDVPGWLDRTKLPTRTGRNSRGTYTAYLIPNEDPYSLVNTLQKMACKRAYIHAVVSVTRSSGLFTQDVEDLPAEAFGVVEDERTWERPVVVAVAEDLPSAETIQGNIVDRDMKPANTPQPSPPPAAPPAPPAPATPAGMSDEEGFAVTTFAPRFAAAKTWAEYQVARDDAARGRRNASAPYKAWHREMCAQTEAALGPVPKPGTAATQPGRPSAPATAGRSVAS